MSSSYTTEPPPNGRVTLETSCGPLDIFLFSNEAPKHCRHFLSLVEAEYFTSTPHRTVFFHRLVKDFVVQFGGPQGTSYHRPSLAAASSKRASSSTTDFPPSSIEAAALSASVEQHLLSPPVGGSVDPPAPRPEKHSRLRFIHRGLLCHARRPPPPPPIGSSSSSSSSSASASPDVGVGCGEFFLTLSDTSTLDKEGYTIVGTVRGQTLFNLARVADVSANAAIEALGGEDEAAAKGGGGALDVPAAAAVKVLRATVVETPTMAERRDEQDLKEGGGMTQGRKLLSLPWDDKFVSERIKAGEGGEANLKPEQERKKRLKAVRNVNVLSFGGDEEEGDDGAPPPLAKPMQQASKKPKASVVEIDKSTTEQKVARPPSPPPLPASQAQQQQSRATEDPDDAATPPSDSDSDSDSDVPKGRSAPASSSVPSSSKKSVVDDMRSKFLAAKAAKAAAFGGSLVAVGGAADKEAARRKEEETLARLEEFQRKRKTN